MIETAIVDCKESVMSLLGWERPALSVVNYYLQVDITDITDIGIIIVRR